MEALKRIRAAQRAAFTKAYNNLEHQLNLHEVDVNEAEALFHLFKQKDEKLEETHQKTLDMLSDENVSEIDFYSEYENIEEYRDKAVRISVKAQRIIHQNNQREHKMNDVITDENHISRTKQRLPEVELRNFGGDLKEWLGFWNQFQKINENEELTATDKFHYLLQSTISGSVAREIVESYPATEKNYPLVIESLKERFGREDVLIEVYVRDLLGMVLNNILKRKQRDHLDTLYNRLSSQLRALSSLGVTSDKCAAILYPLVESCLPEENLRAWERARSHHSIETQGENKSEDLLDALLKFLKNEVHGEERMRLARSGFGSPVNKDTIPGIRKAAAETPCVTATAAELFTSENSTRRPDLCLFCNKQHDSRNCYMAMKMSLADKIALLRKKGHCFTCLKSGHMSRTCRGAFTCPDCSGRHIKVMCPKLGKTNTPDNSSQGNTSDPGKDNVLSAHACSSEVQMQTLVVKMLCGKKKLLVRALIDTGSQKSYIDATLAKRMGYDAIGQEKIIHSLFGGVETQQEIHTSYNVRLSNLEESYCCTFKVIDQHIICGTVPQVKQGPWISDLEKQGINISDLGKTCRKIELLIGADVAGKLLTGKIQHLESGLVAIETHLGWTLMGKIPSCEPRDDNALILNSMFVRDAEIPELWKLETIGIVDSSEILSKKEREDEALKRFQQTTIVNEDGRYEVSLPWIDERPPLPSNREVAEKRLQVTTRKLIENQRFADYDGIFREWLREGIIEEITEENGNACDYYLPHRAVVKDESLTTKVRPVFDASAKTKDNPSLNDCLEKGPNLIELIPGILARFRMGPTAVVSDLRKAFLQISVKEGDRNCLKFLWWKADNRQQMKVFRHNRVVFGLTSSPFLLGATLEFHLDKAPDELKDTAKKLKDSFYVDNCVCSLPSSNVLAKFIQESNEVMKTAKFEFHSWASNHKTDIPGISLQCSGEVHVLGILWDLSDDTLKCDLNGILASESVTVTKRHILSIAHRIFDPIGFVCPVLLLPKILLRETWKLKIGWDDELPPEICERYVSWKSTLLVLQELKIPRWLVQGSCSSEKYSLHVFNDASAIAYACCIFLRCENENGVSVQLVQAKSRVAPMKSVTIPRLELLACTIGVRLADTVKKDMRFTDVTTYYWTDATTVLCWIKNSGKWKVFTSNRVREIREKSDVNSWRYIPGSMNPADLPSRGCSANHLCTSKWWEGPHWLKQPKETWPSSEFDYDVEAVDTERVAVNVTTAINKPDKYWYCHYFSEYTKVLRMHAYILRFINNARVTREDRFDGELSLIEIENAERSLMRLVQESFVESNEELRGLNTFKDDKGILRLTTRILLREDSYDFRNPIILPSRHPLVERLVRHYHTSLCHAGVQVLMSTLREKFWIIRARKSIRQIVRACVKCRRYDAEKSTMPIAPLPVDRVKNSAVFEITGIDLAGPLLLKGGEKAWVVLFTCAVYRAIHLELVTSLSTSAFLQCFRRFVARRGRPKTIYSDNGTNFVGADNILSRIDYKIVNQYAVVERINWKFNPPTAAWWGGWWERLIRMIKSLLRRVLGKSSLRYEELLTVLCDCEKVINSRPLTYVSEDPEDLSPITPSMFLQQIPETGVSELDYLDAEGLNKRLQYLQTLRENLKKRFRKEYLGQLVDRNFRNPKRSPVKRGDLVLVGSDNTKRFYWPLAKVIELYPGRDGLSRVALLKTNRGNIVRPIQRLYRLEVDSLNEAQLLNQDAQSWTRSGRIVKPML